MFVQARQWSRRLSAGHNVSPELIDAAVRQARQRSLIDKSDEKAIRARRRAA